MSTLTILALIEMFDESVRPRDEISDDVLAGCRLPGERDHFRAGFAMSMGPPVCH
jgi:hypothetical protein